LLLDPPRTRATSEREPRMWGGRLAELLNDWSPHGPGAAARIPSSAPALAARGMDQESVGAGPLMSEAAITHAALRLT
jgi:hypothetical protein